MSDPDFAHFNFITNQKFYQFSVSLDLNPAQQRAVEECGVQLILAGPGSGKTRVITEKIHQLLTEAGKRNRSHFITQCIEAYLSPPSHVDSGELKDLQNKLNVKEQELAKLKAEIEMLQSTNVGELQDLQNKLNVKEQELAKTLDEIEKLRSDNSSLQIKYDELATTNQESNKSNVVVVTGLQHNVELKEAQIKALEHEIALQKGTIYELKDDKERLSKQNELFTAHLLSPPKKPLLTRIKERFGRKVEGEATT